MRSVVQRSLYGPEQKPHICRSVFRRMWMCVSYCGGAYGITPEKAYERWRQHTQRVHLHTWSGET